MSVRVVTTGGAGGAGGAHASRTTTVSRLGLRLTNHAVAATRVMKTALIALMMAVRSNTHARGAVGGVILATKTSSSSREMVAFGAVSAKCASRRAASRTEICGEAMDVLGLRNAGSQMFR